MFLKQEVSVSFVGKVLQLAGDLQPKLATFAKKLQLFFKLEKIEIVGQIKMRRINEKTEKIREREIERERDKFV